jgi:hypothetical protein
MHARAARGAAVRTHRRRAASPPRRTAAWIFAPAACGAEAGERGRSWDRDAWNRSGRPAKKRRVLGEQEIAGVQAAQTHVLQDDGVARVQRNDRVIADLMACGLNGREILEHATVELDTVIVAEIADDVMAESAREVREYRGLTVCGARAATWNLSREGMLPANGR